MFEYIVEYLITLELKPVDVALIVLSPVCSILGSYVHVCLLEMNPNKIPGPGQTIMFSQIDAIGRAKWMLMRLIVGAVLGLVFAFYFVGTLVESPTSLFKLLAFAVLVGYSAPRLWFMQEQILIEQIDSKVRKAVDSAIRSTRETSAQQGAEGDTVDRAP